MSRDLTTAENFYYFILPFTPLKRSLTTVQQLYRYKATMRAKLSEKAALQVEADPEQFFNPNKFRWLRNKSYHRAWALAVPNTLGVLFLIKYIGLYKARFTPPHFIGVFMASTLFYYPFMRTYVGWNREEHYKNEYSYILKKLRNIEIRN